MRKRSAGASVFLVASTLLLVLTGAADASRPAQDAGKTSSKPTQTKASGANVTSAKAVGAKTTGAKVSSVQAPATIRPVISTARANTVPAMARGQQTQASQAYNNNLSYGRGYTAHYRGYSRSGRAATGYVAGRGTGRGGMSCVPYARSVTGMNVSGNAWQWWHNAAGLYSRGQMPEAGSVLAFRSNTRMPMGHVAVVSRVESSRVVMIDHANWPVGGRRGAVSAGVSVVDVSDRNDWSAVRVSLGQGSDFGSVYPTHGFIYNRPDTGMIRAATQAPAPQLALNAPPRDLRGRGDRSQAMYADRAYDEVAEAPASPTTSRPAYIIPVQPYSVTIPSAVFNGGN